MNHKFWLAMFLAWLVLLSKMFPEISFVLEILATDFADLIIINMYRFDVMIEHFFRWEQLPAYVARQTVFGGLVKFRIISGKK